jgi:NAD(P)-dependent dehydrogenase (short-subunit alcohol dehydrogenase family)
MRDYFKIEGKTAIVTGAGNGIGRATAKMMASFGVNVTACDIEVDSIESLGREIRDSSGSVLALMCDVTNLDNIRHCVQQTLDAFGTIDILVNNAAGCGGGKRIDDMTMGEWDRLIRLNLTSVYMFTMAVLPTMRAKGAGKIVNISSGSAIIGDFSDPHYAASKGGVISLTREMAVELAKEGININTVAPGVTDTRMAHSPDRAWEDEIADNKWIRVGLPEDQAAAILFMASAASDYLTGQMLCPNGGAWM